MSDVYKILGQIVAPVDILTAASYLYTVPVAAEVQIGDAIVAPKAVSQIPQTLITSIIVCDTDSMNRTFNVALQSVLDEDEVVDAEYLIKSRPLAANETKILSLGLTLGPGNILRVSASVADVVAFTVMGIEVT